MKRTPLLALSRLGVKSLYRDGRLLLPSDRVQTILLAPEQERALPGTTTDFTSIEYLRLDATKAWRERATWHLENSGIERIVAPNERFLGLAAVLREEYGIDGISVQEAELFTNKLVMKRALAASEVRVPRFAPAHNVSDIVAFPTFPAVLKRIDFSGGRGVYIARSVREAVAAWEAHHAEGDFEIEEFVDGTMYHCDSIVMDGLVRFSAVSRYLAKPGDYHAGGVGGSVLVEVGDLQKRVLALNSEALCELGLREGVTHLELFRTASDELVFCEVAARPGGGGIAQYLLNAHGVDIQQAALWLDAGLGLPAPQRAGSLGTFGCVGIYPSDSDLAVIDAVDLKPFGVVAVNVLHSRGQFEPEHCTDHIALFQIRGDNPGDFDERTRALCAALGIDQELTSAD